MNIFHTILGQDNGEIEHIKGQTLTPYTFYNDHIAATAYQWRQDTWLQRRRRELREENQREIAADEIRRLGPWKGDD